MNKKTKPKTKRMTNKYWSGYFSATGEIISHLESKIEQFQKLEVSKEDCHNIDFRLIKIVLADSIILDMSKVIGVNKSDQTGFRQIKLRLSGKDLQEYKKQLDFLEKKHKQMILKISANRNKIIAHLDFNKKPFYEMKFSKDEIDRMYTYNPYLFKDMDDFKQIKDHATKVMHTPQKRNQRYGMADFKKDIPVFLEIIKEFKEMIHNINQAVYLRSE